MSKSFWNTQPVENGKSLKSIVKSRNIPKERLPLPGELYWEITEDIPRITDFLKDNYVEDNNNKFRLFYSQNFFEYLFEDPNHRKEYSLSIVNSTKEMVGYVLAKEHCLVINDVEQHVVSINFLCLKCEYRKKNIAPTFIKEITRVVNTFGIFHAIFTGHQNYGFAVAKCVYYHFPLDIKRLYEIGYVDNIWDDDHDKYKISAGTTLASAEDLRLVYKNYCENTHNYSCYEKLTENEFLYIFGAKNKSVYMLYNRYRNEYASFFVIQSLSIEKNEYFGTAYLYYWDGSYRIIEDAICYAKSIGLVMFNMLDLNGNNKLIKDFGLIEGDGELWYHLYNWRENNIANEKLNFILF